MSMLNQLAAQNETNAMGYARIIYIIEACNKTPPMTKLPALSTISEFTCFIVALIN